MINQKSLRICVSQNISCSSLPCSHPPTRCMWSDCCPPHGSPRRWSPAAARPSSGCLWLGPCRQRCSCSGKWCSGMLQWTEASRKSAERWRRLQQGHPERSWTVGPDRALVCLESLSVSRQNSEREKFITYVLLYRSTLTWNPPFMVSPNQTCLRSLLLLVHQFFFGTLAMLG